MKRLIFLILFLFLIGCVKEPVELEEQNEAPSMPEMIEEAMGFQEFEVTLTSDFKMVPENLTISVGDKVRWTNEGERVRNLKIYNVRIFNLREKDIIRSQNIAPGESFEYIFEEKGEYSVEDVYKYSVRGMITAEVVNLDGDDLGMVVVE